MPLSKTGKKIRRNFKKEYGKNWERIFYAWENEKKHKSFILKKTKTKGGTKR